ncbi:MAG: hypothetical protein V3G42_02025 [Oscillospiraceae bacterium]
MQDVSVNIPEYQEDEGWQPPMITEFAPEETDEQAPEKIQSVADVFFMQYIGCIIILTVLLIIRILDEPTFRHMAELFLNYSRMPSETWAVEAVEAIRNLWR